MWLICKFLHRNMTWESRLEFFQDCSEQYIENQMKEYLLRNFATYAGVLVCNDNEILCAIVQ